MEKHNLLREFKCFAMFLCLGSYKYLFLQLAGILLDSQNLNKLAALSVARDSEAVQLLSVGSAPSYLYDQCTIFCPLSLDRHVKSSLFIQTS